MTEPRLLTPLPYHREIRDYLKIHERELWAWFASVREKENYAEALRLSLLKSTYRLAPESHVDLYAQVMRAAEQLGLNVKVTLYQAQASTTQPNAALYWVQSEAHIVLHGPIVTLLNAEEMTSVFAHELSHYLLWECENQEFLIADRIIHSAAEASAALPAQIETARRFRLYTEIFADRGAAQVTQNLNGVVAALVKISTGLTSVSGESYLAQAAEIFEKGPVETEHSTHPEIFIRTQALALWTKMADAADDPVAAMIAGGRKLDRLDLVEQERLVVLTRKFLEQLLSPSWFRSDPAMGQARLYFPDFTPAAASDESLVNEVLETNSLVKEYFVFLLLDFARVDRALDDVSLAACLQWAEKIGVSTEFEKLAIKELGVKKSELTKLKVRAADLLMLAEKGL